MNLYEILGLINGKIATPNEIRANYRSLSKEYHPDVNPDGMEMFLKIKQAYETLSDPVARKIYDETGQVKDATKQKQTAILLELLSVILNDSEIHLMTTDIFKVMSDTVKADINKMMMIKASNKKMIERCGLVKKGIKETEKSLFILNFLDIRINQYEQDSGKLDNEVKEANKMLDFIETFHFGMEDLMLDNLGLDPEWYNNV